MSGQICDRCDNPAEVNLGLYMDEPVLLCGECYEASGQDDRPDYDYEYGEDYRYPDGEVDFEDIQWASYAEGEYAEAEGRHE